MDQDRSRSALSHSPKFLALAAGLAVLLAFGVSPLLDSPLCEGPCVDGVSGAETITVTYLADGGETDSFSVPIGDDRMANASEGWAWIPRSKVPEPLETKRPAPSSGVATVGEWALVGDLTAATERIGPREVTIVTPAASSAEPNRIAGALSDVTAPYSLEPDRSDPVYLIYAPRVLPDKGRMYGHTGYVTTPYFRDGAVSSVWLHEYVHSLQNFDTEAEMQWFREASATYLPKRFLGEQYSDVGEAEVRQRLLAIDSSMVCLCNVTACEETNADYHRGARLLYAIDSEIRRSTGGAASLVDVFREMNARTDSISLAEFQRICEAVSGEEMGWIRRVVQNGNYDLKKHIVEIESFGGDAATACRPASSAPVAAEGSTSSGPE